MLDAIFGKKKDPKEVFREYKHKIEHSIREINREVAKLRGQETKLINDIKRAAKKNEMQIMRIMAKDLIATRNNQKRFIQMQAQLQSICLRITTLRATADMTSAMSGVTKAMKMMNEETNIYQLKDTMKDFLKANETLDLKNEIMDDVLSDALGDAGDAQAEEAIVSQVLDEIMLKNKQQIGGATVPTNAVQMGAGPAAAVAEEAIDEDELEKKLASLKK